MVTVSALVSSFTDTTSLRVQKLAKTDGYVSACFTDTTSLRVQKPIGYRIKVTAFLLIPHPKIYSIRCQDCFTDTTSLRVQKLKLF